MCSKTKPSRRIKSSTKLMVSSWPQTIQVEKHLVMLFEKCKLAESQIFFWSDGFKLTSNYQELKIYEGMVSGWPPTLELVSRDAKFPWTFWKTSRWYMSSTKWWFKDVHKL